MAKSHHLMFDIDGTLVESFGFDEQCYMAAVYEVFDEPLNNNWHEYPHITDTGILQHFLEQNNRPEPLNETIHLVKQSFIKRIQQHISNRPVKPIEGALDFFDSVSNDYSVSIATGGWRETAELKLNSAGFAFSNIPIASSNDHYARIKIMQHSIDLAKIDHNTQISYFGDGEWDKTACAELGINFIAVGDRVEYHQQIKDFKDVDRALSFVT